MDQTDYKARKKLNQAVENAYNLATQYSVRLGFMDYMKQVANKNFINEATLEQAKFKFKYSISRKFANIINERVMAGQDFQNWKKPPAVSKYFKRKQIKDREKFVIFSNQDQEDEQNHRLKLKSIKRLFWLQDLSTRATNINHVFNLKLTDTLKNKRYYISEFRSEIFQRID